MVKLPSLSHIFFLYVQHLKLVTAIICLKVIITYFKRLLKRLYLIFSNFLTTVFLTKASHFLFIFSALLLKKTLETGKIYW